jgi:type VI secretion system protein ImpA
MGLLNTDELLAPISESNPCGICKETSEDLNLLNAFAKLQMEGESARKIEKTRVEIELLDSDSRAEKIRNSAGRSDDPKKDTNWPSIASQCIDILTTKSKDTRIVSWLIEALMRSGGFRGLSESLDFAASLVDKYGTQLFPLDEDDELYALGFLDKLNQSSSLMDGMGRIPYRKGSKVGYSSKIIARHLESLDGSRRSELQETGLLMYDEIEEEVAQASLEVKQEFAASIAQAIESAKRLDQALANKSGSSGFGFGNVLKEITTIQDWFSELAGDLAENGGSSDSGEDAKSGGADNDSSGHVEPESAASKGTVTKPGTIQNREDALASLVRVASFFRKTEPHSPVSYALEQAVRWGKMPLPELLMDLVQNTDVRGEVFRRLGIIEKSNEDTD